MNICTGGTGECKHLRGKFALVATELEEVSLGLLPLQCLHALQVAGHQGTAVLWEGFCQKRIFGKEFENNAEENFVLTPPSARQASFALARSSQSAALGVASTTGASYSSKCKKYQKNLVLVSGEI